MAISTFSPSLDGRTLIEGAATWATARSTTSAGASSSESSQVNSVQAVKVSSSDWRLGRSFFVFNTSTIPSSATITAATLAVTIAYTDANENIGVTECYLQNTAALVSSDHPRVYDTILSDYQGTGTTANVTKTFTLNATGLTKVIKGGTTQFAVRAQQDITNSAPADGDTNAQGLHFFESSTSAYRPLLTVTYTVPSAALFFQQI